MNPSSGSSQGNWPPPEADQGQASSSSTGSSSTPQSSGSSYQHPSTLYSTPASHSYIISQSQAGAHSTRQTQQAAIAAPDNVNPFQLGPQGIFPVYHQAAPAAAGGETYARMSPVSEFSTVDSSDSAGTLQQLQQRLQDGRAHIITVPMVMGALSVPEQVCMATASASTSSQPMGISMARGVPISIAMGHSRAVAMTTNTVASSVQSHPIVATREHAVSYVVQDGREHSVSEQGALYQVVGPIEQLGQAEPSSSEATPLVEMAEQRNTIQVIGETFISEPDTTQNEDSPSFHAGAVQHVESSEAFPDPSEATPLCLSQEGSEVTVDSSGLDPGFGEGVRLLASNIDSTMDSTVDDRVLEADNTEDTGDEQVDTSGQPGAEADLQHMLANAASMPGAVESSILAAEGEVALQPAAAAFACQAGPSTAMEAATEDSKDQQTLLPVRKSERIAQLNDQQPSPAERPKYISKSYSVHEIWCEECQTTYAAECPKHKSVYIYDKVVLSRAWATLPPQLAIFRLGETTVLGVFAKKSIPKRTHFGPFMAELVPAKAQLSSSKFPLQVDREDGNSFFLEASDENNCNWMMFVRPAESYAEQNLVAFQFGNDIFFATMKNIEPRQELKVWYAAHYAERMGEEVHEMSEADLAALDAQELRWPCFECPRKFKTSAQLQKHLLIHEDSNFASTAAAEREAKQRSPKKNHSGGKRSRSKPKKIRELMSDESSGFQSWKKRTSKLYLTHAAKMKKYREPIKRSIKTLYKKTRESGVSEWVCTHCSLTFDNPSLLNLHTLTHAAENVGLMDTLESEQAPHDNVVVIAPEVDAAAAVCTDNVVESAALVCPVCTRSFEKKADLIQHASEHGRVRHRTLINPKKPYKCSQCWKAFTLEEKLQCHMASHDDSRKTLECTVCLKRFMNNAALACHMKTHSDSKYYDCPLCKMEYERAHDLKIHVDTHREDGLLNCTHCHKSFTEYRVIRKHMRAFHSENKVACPECGRSFPRADKLRIHMLSHTNHREFMCEACGKQFKRKDKLREHTKRMHNPEREALRKFMENRRRETVTKKFVPRVSPNDYHRFIYKCHTCLLGFKRRGMLVNHLAKRHPEVTPDSVPELNLPILKTQRDYYCQYCEKVYKSSSKRKSHILRNHPGAEIPPSARKQQPEVDVPGLPNSTFSTPVGSVTTVPHSCTYCHKQYASKAKLMQHQRKKHTDHVAPATRIRRMQQNVVTMPIPNVDMDAPVLATLLPNQGEVTELTPLVLNQGGTAAVTVQPSNGIQGADLLTQAMSELTQSLGSEFRPQQEFHVAGNRVIQAGNATIVQPNHVPQPTTIELSALGNFAQTAHFQPQAGQITVSGGGATVQPITLAVNSDGQTQASTVPITIAHTFIPRTWATTNVSSLQTATMIFK